MSSWTETLNAQSEMLATQSGASSVQSELMTLVTARLEALERVAIQPSSNRRPYSEAVWLAPIPTARQLLAFFRCGGLQLKRECPVRETTSYKTVWEAGQ